MGLTKNFTDADLIKYLNSCYIEAEQARVERDDFTSENYDAFHLRKDFSHKMEGQSREVLSKIRMGTLQTSSFFQQALADTTKWFSCSYRDTSVPQEALLLKDHEIERLLRYMLDRASYFTHVGLLVQRACLGGMLISKCFGKMEPKPMYKLKTEGKGKDYRKYVQKVEDQSWVLCFDRIRNEDFFPDPTGNNLYCIEEMEVPLHIVKARAKGDDAIYDLSKVNELSTAQPIDTEKEYERSLETGQSQVSAGGDHRPMVRIKEYWGDIVSADGEMLFENCVFTVANDTTVIRKPTHNPLWHQMKPYIFTPLLDVDKAVWAIALMDAATKHQNTMTELLNLIIDAGFKKVHAPGQIRVNDLANPEQVADGIKPGMMLKVKSSLPIGGKVMEPLEAVDVPNDGLNILNLLQQELNQSALTTDLRSGVLPDRSVKATEVVEQSQTITSVFQGISKNIEQNHIVPELEMAWMTIAQNLDMISKDVLIGLFGEKRGTEISQLDPQDVFVQTVNGYKFQVFGITQTLAKAQDFRKLTTMLQTISASELLLEEFIQKYDMGKLLGEIMETLNIDTHKIELEEQEIQQPGDAMGMGTNPMMQQTPSAAGIPANDFLSVMGQSAPGQMLNQGQ